MFDTRRRAGVATPPNPRRSRRGRRKTRQISGPRSGPRIAGCPRIQPCATDLVTGVAPTDGLRTYARREPERGVLILFDPTELLERLAVLVPRPNVNLLIYHGVLAGHAGSRSRVVAHRVVAQLGLELHSPAERPWSTRAIRRGEP